MEVRHHHDISNDTHEFKAVMDFQDLAGVTEKALVAQIETLITRIVDKLVTHFVDTYRSEIMKHISVLDVVEQIHKKAGDKLVLELLQQVRIK